MDKDVEQLLVALESAANYIDKLGGSSTAYRQHISAIAERYSGKSRLTELEKDAARLNFIEKRHDMRLSTRNGKWWAFDKFSNYEQATYATLREAIDAAIQAEAMKSKDI